MDTTEPISVPELPAAPRYRRYAGWAIRILVGLLGFYPITIAVLGQRGLAMLEEMFSELGTVLPPLPHFLLYWGGIYPAGFVALTGIALMVAAWFGRWRWMTAAFVIALVASYTVIPATVSVVNEELSRVIQQMEK